MINFLLEVTGIKRLYDRWVVNQVRKRIDAEERLFQQNLNNLWQKPKNEFCLYCGAGIGEFRREGEGTCPRCNP